MELNSDSVILNSCELTPVYLIPTSGVTQAVPCIIAPSNPEVQKPVSDNLKRFYENSGNLENGILSSPKPRILKKQPSLLGNNLKMASFLRPKREPQSVPMKQITLASTDVPISSVVVQPTVTTVNTNVVNTIPKMEISRKIVRIGTIPAPIRTQPRSLPKICRPKEETNLSKHTSVQLLKLGETYHSLNQLSEEQMKIVNHALKMFSGPEKIPKEPAYDPITNTKFIYKVVSPRDLTVVGKNKLLKHKKNIMKKQEAELEEEIKQEVKPQEPPKVTRSGRTVKLPKQMLPEETPQKPKKKTGNTHTCFQCSAEFSSLYRLQRHHENYPTHIPAKTHTNLFHCLLAIIKGSSEDDQANIFVQQLEQLVQKIKNLLPCLMKTVEGKEGRLCTINEDIGRLFGLDPGKYSLNMDALVCVKNKEGHCVHNPPPMNPQLNPDMSKPSQMWLSEHNEEIAQTETEDCARINPVDKWPTVSKRNWMLKQQRTQNNAKRIRLSSENEQFIELGTDDLVTFSTSSDESAITASQKIATPLDNASKVNKSDSVEQKTTSTENQSKPKGARVQFHSTHFDIRSSPIKPSGQMRKFKLDPDKLPTFKVQIMRPLTNNEEQNDIVIESNNDNALDLQDILRENGITKADINTEINFDKNKTWHIATEAENGTQSNDSFMKGDLLFDTSLTPLKVNNLIEPSLLHIGDKSNDLLETPIKSINLDEAPVTVYSHTSNNSSFNQSLLNLKAKSNGLFGPDIQVSTEPSSLIEPSLTTANAFEQSLIYVKSESRAEPTMTHTTKDPIINSGMFDPTSMYVKSESNGHLDHSLIHHKESYKTCLQDKSDTDGVFQTALSHVMERSHSLFEPRKEKDSLIGPSLIHVHNKPVSGLTMRKDDGFAIIEMKDKSSFIEPSLLDMKDDKSQQLDVNPSDCLNNSDSSQGHSVLNFLESLGNELAYPETEIRNNSVDFQLDLFSFNSS